VIIVVIARIVPPLVTTVVATVLTPVHQLQVWLREGHGTLPYWWRDRAALVAEVQQLERALHEAERNAGTLGLLQLENRELRSLLGDAADTRILAGVITTEGALPYDILQLDRGAVDGIVVGAPVFVGAHAVLGLVTQVTATYSIVQPFSAPNFLTTVYLPATRSFATMEGVGGGVARVRVPQGVRLQVGDSVRVPGSMAGQYGQITHVVNEPNQPEQFGYVSPRRPLRSLAVVAVGVSPVVAPTTLDLEALLATSSPWYVPEIAASVQVATTTTTPQEVATTTTPGLE
jgi:hypothetical protein